MEIIKNFSNSIHNYINSGFKNVSKETKNKRLNICSSCEYYNSIFSQCSQCGCLLEIKTTWATEKCPLDKWDAEITPDSPEEQPLQQVSQLEDCGCNKK